VLAGFKRGDGKFGMRLRRRANIDHLNRGICEEVGEVAISLHLGHVEFERFARPNVTRDRGKIAVEIAAAGIAEGGDAAGVDSTVGPEVRGGHEAKADNSHPDRLSRFAFCAQSLIRWSNRERFEKLSRGADVGNPLGTRLALDAEVAVEFQLAFWNGWSL